MLTLTNVSKQFGGLKAVSGVSRSFAAGAISAVIGPNGAGKTTLFSLIAGTARPTSGRIVFRNRDITGRPPASVCRLGIARTFQVVRPFWQLSVRDHLRAAALFGGAGADHARTEHLLDITGLADRADWPARALTLAGCKRLEIARALATGAELILLDETMAGLTPEEAHEAIALVRRIRDEGRTVVLIEHVLRTVTDLCERVIVLDYGQVIADGPPHDVLGSDVVKKAYLG